MEGENEYPDVLTMRSDLWGVGGIAWNLRNSIRAFDIPDIRDEWLWEHDDRLKLDEWTFERVPAPRPPQPPARPPQYTTWMEEIVEDCMENNLNERPDTTELITRLEEGVDNLRKLLSLGEDDLARVGPRLDTGVLLRVADDQFPLGRVLNLTRRRRP